MTIKIPPQSYKWTTQIISSMELPHYDVFKQKVSKPTELSNSYITKTTMGPKGSEHFSPILTNSIDPFKNKLIENWNMYVLP